MTTYVIFDIDGVFNPFYARYNPELAAAGFVYLNRDKEGFFLNPEMHVKWLTAISEHSTCVWGSAWEAESNLVLELLNINQTWGYVPLDREDVGLGTWKLKSVKRWVEQNLKEGDRLVWVDDELEDDVSLWGDTLGDHLFIKPAKEQGLTEQDFINIHNFVNHK